MDYATLESLTSFEIAPTIHSSQTWAPRGPCILCDSICMVHTDLPEQTMRDGYGSVVKR